PSNTAGASSSSGVIRSWSANCWLANGTTISWYLSRANESLSPTTAGSSKPCEAGSPSTPVGAGHLAGVQAPGAPGPCRPAGDPLRGRVPQATPLTPSPELPG